MTLEQIQALCDQIIACQDKERAVILAEQVQIVLHERIDQIEARSTRVPNRADAGSSVKSCKLQR